MVNRTNYFILDTFDFPKIINSNDMASSIGVSPQMIYVLSGADNFKYYKNFKIPKRDGTSRNIHKPSYSMKVIQRWILQEILYKIPPTEYSYGFKKSKGSPLKKNAEVHSENLFIMKMDLKNFFPSVKRKKIYHLFSQIGYNEVVSNLLTNLTTINGMLPQGAVTSPYIASLVCRNLDKRISKYCNKRQIKYSRYADDLIFSSNDKNQVKSIYNMIKKIVEDEGFLLNVEKTKVMTPKIRKSITGVTVNNGIKAPKKMKKKIRAMIHQAIITGDYTKSNEIKGYIAYISSIEEDYIIKTKEYINGFASKKVCIFEDVVKNFNDNKFFSDLKDFRLKKPSDFVDYEDIDEFSDYQYRERQDFMNKNK